MTRMVLTFFNGKWVKHHELSWDYVFFLQMPVEGSRATKKKKRWTQGKRFNTLYVGVP